MLQLEINNVSRTYPPDYPPHLFAWRLQWPLRRLPLRFRSRRRRSYRHHFDHRARFDAAWTNLIGKMRSRMSRLRLHSENHLVNRIGWMRAAVLGANDGIISTASLIVGVAAAATARHEILIAGIAGLVAGPCR